MYVVSSIADEVPYRPFHQHVHISYSLSCFLHAMWISFIIHGLRNLEAWVMSIAMNSSYFFRVQQGIKVYGLMGKLFAYLGVP